MYNDEVEMNMKLGRNKKCWCGSDKKFKKCHLSRSSEDPLKIQDAIKETKKNKEKFCLHPEANPTICNQIIQAHSIQKSGIISEIARNQHIYEFSADLGDMIKHNRIEPKLIGINKASTFSGFCNFHDTETFKPIETSQIQINNEHIFLIAYRSLCKEIYAKKYQINTLSFIKKGDRGLNELQQLIHQKLVYTYETGVQAGLNDLLKIKNIYDQILLNKNFQRIKYYAIQIDSIPEIVCSGNIFVEMDFQGNILQTNNEIENLAKNLDRVSFSILMSNKNGIIVFSCLDTETKSITFFKSIEKLPDNDLPNAIVRFAFEFFENTFMAPDWWDNLQKEDKDKIIKRMNNLSDNERDKNCLLDDGLNIVNWKILNRYKNF